MAEHAGLIQVITFRPAPGRRDEVLALCAETQERAAAADGCFGAQTCAVDHASGGRAAATAARCLLDIRSACQAMGTILDLASWADVRVSAGPDQAEDARPPAGYRAACLPRQRRSRYRRRQAVPSPH